MAAVITDPATKTYKILLGNDGGVFVSKPSADPGTSEGEVTTLPVIELQAAQDDGAPADATAEAPPQATPPPSSTTLEEIVVTAQRRAEKLQDVPIAVSAFSRDQVESRGIQRIDDLNSLAPGLQISRSPANTTISQITIRGITSTNFTETGDPAVGFHVDGMYSPRPQGAQALMFDIEAKIVRSQILIAQGLPLSHPEVGLESQSKVITHGYAIQCRVTTEDPLNNFIPDYGRLTAYRSATGNGIRVI